MNKKGLSHLCHKYSRCWTVIFEIDFVCTNVVAYLIKEIWLKITELADRYDILLMQRKDMQSPVFTHHRGNGNSLCEPSIINVWIALANQPFVYLCWFYWTKAFVLPVACCHSYRLPLCCGDALALAPVWKSKCITGDLLTFQLNLC